MRAALTLLVVGIIAVPALAEEPELRPWLRVGFAILRSTTDFSEAERIDATAAKDLGIKIDRRGLIPDPEHGLTWPKEECDKDSLYPYPCYLARGRFDAGVYLSIERSDAYRAFRPGYYVVIAASGNTDTPEFKTVLRHVVGPRRPRAHTRRSP